tara:strand:+ start:869 stop:1318 length:450 start_codon:yes stop_codon:yes gene_type:complete
MYKNKNHIDNFESFINEERDAVYNTNYTGMATSAVANLYTSIMAIAQEMCNEKAARDPYNNAGDIEEVDISRAINLIFHSEWKKNLKSKCLQGIQSNTAERAGKRDELSNKKNHKALANLQKGDNTISIDKSTVRFSDMTSGKGPGSNQ